MGNPSDKRIALLLRQRSDLALLLLSFILLTALAGCGSVAVANNCVGSDIEGWWEMGTPEITLPDGNEFAFYFDPCGDLELMRIAATDPDLQFAAVFTFDYGNRTMTVVGSSGGQTVSETLETGQYATTTREGNKIVAQFWTDLTSGPIQGGRIEFMLNDDGNTMGFRPYFADIFPDLNFGLDVNYPDVYFPLVRMTASVINARPRFLDAAG